MSETISYTAPWFFDSSPFGGTRLTGHVRVSLPQPCRALAWIYTSWGSSAREGLSSILCALTCLRNKICYSGGREDVYYEDQAGQKAGCLSSVLCVQPMYGQTFLASCYCTAQYQHFEHQPYQVHDLQSRNSATVGWFSPGDNFAYQLSGPPYSLA